jgi:hypothetical protein
LAAAADEDMETMVPAALVFMLLEPDEVAVAMALALVEEEESLAEDEDED